MTQAETERACIWRNIREAAELYEAPGHLSDTALRRVMDWLLPHGPLWLADYKTLGIEIPEFMLDDLE